MELLRAVRGEWVYPRVCGGTPAIYPYTLAADGLSPRVRGNRGHTPRFNPPPGSIPACAGEPPAPCGGGTR